MRPQKQSGFSLIELLIAMTLTLTVMSIATVLLAQALNMRTRTNANNDALAKSVLLVSDVTLRNANLPSY